MQDVLKDFEEAVKENEQEFYLKILSFIVLRPFHDNFDKVVEFYNNGNYFIGSECSEEQFVKELVIKCKQYDDALLNNLIDIEKLAAESLKKVYNSDNQHKYHEKKNDTKKAVAWWRVEEAS